MNQSYPNLLYKKYLRVFILLIGFTILISSTFTLQAQTVPQQITYQGKLVENGRPFSGSATMVFELINPSNSIIEWTETQTIDVQDGLYSVVLGVQNPFTPNFFSQNPSLGLRVSVNGNTLTPITVLRAVPYSLSAGSVSNNSITSLKIVNGTIQTIDIASGGQNKVLITDGNGQVVWADRATVSNATGAAGGDLTGSYPNPTIADDAVTTDKIASSGSPNQVLSTDGSNNVVWQDSKINITNSDAVPRWNGIELVDGSITDDGASVNISSSTSIGSLSVNDLSIGGFNVTSLTTAGGGVSTPFSDNALVSELAMTNYVANQLSGVTLSQGNGITINGSNEIGLGGTLSDTTTILGNNGASRFGVNFSDLSSFSTSTSFDTKIESNQNIELDADNDIELSAEGNIELEADQEVQITLIDDAAFIIQDDVSNELLSIRNSNTDVFDLNVDLGVTDQVLSGGEINLKAQDADVSGNLFDGANLLVEGGNADLFRGGNIILNGGAGVGNKGTIFIQNDGGNVQIGSSSFDSELRVNGWLNLPVLDPPPSDPTSKLYVDGSGELTWQGVSLLTSSNALNAGNGITINGSNEVDLGGELNQNTTITSDNGEHNFSIDLNSPVTPISVGGSIELIAGNVGGNGTAGNVTIKAGNETTSSGTAGNILLNSGTGDVDGDIELNANFTGNIILSSDTEVVGSTVLQQNVTIGNSGTPVPLTLNGWIDLPSLPATLPGALSSNLSNKLYSDNVGDLRWGSQNLSQSALLWQRESATQIYFNGTFGDAKVGIGNFNASFPPVSNLHIRRIGAEADMRIATLTGNLNQSSYISLRTATRSGADTEDDLSDDQVVGKILFEGYKNTTFQENAKIDVIVTDASTTPFMESEMRFFVNGNEKMNISDEEVEVSDADFRITDSDPIIGDILTLNKVTGIYNFDLNLKTNSTGSGSGGGVSITAGSTIATGQQGGNVTLSGGNGVLGRGNVNIQPSGGNVSIGIPNSTVFVSGNITLADLPSPSFTGNQLYATGGSLYWGNLNLVAATPWINDGSDNLYYPTNNGTIGIGDFSSNPPSADLHIERVHTSSATIKLSTFEPLLNPAFTGSSIVLQSARSDLSTAPLGINDVIGELVFNGYSDDISFPSFKDAGKIDMITTSNNPSGIRADMRFTLSDASGNLVERMRIASDGIVTIGNPSVISAITTNTANISIQPSSAAAAIANLKLAVQGDIAASGNVHAAANFTTSDARFKTNIQTLQNPLNNILKMRGVSYNWRTEEFADRDFSERLQIGLIAQEVAQIYPEAVETRYDGYLSVNYSSLIPVLIEATKEQQTIIDNQEEEIQTQKTELENLKKQISELKQIVVSLQENSNENSNSALAQKVETLEKQLTALVESLSNKMEVEKTETASLKEEE